MKRKETLLPDKVINDNINFIKEIGGHADNNKVTEYVVNMTLRKFLLQGYEYNDAVKAMEEYIQLPTTLSSMEALLNYNNWYYSGRQIYRFDDTLAETLSSQTKDLPIDTVVLEQLPCNDFFIMRNYNDNQGFFVSISISEENYILTFTELCKDTIDSCVIPIEKNMTLEQSITNFLQKGISAKRLKDNEEIINKTSLIFAEKFQYLLYLSAVNAEIVPITKGAVVKRESTQHKLSDIIKKSRSEVANVGYKIGSDIRSAKGEKEKVVYIHDNNAPKQGTPKSPHVRRSHFHSYWTGNGDNKKLVVKWVNTIFVKGNNSNLTDNSTIHNVK
ncbi:MAG: hypothetical protein ACI3T9_05325 [Romboutsia timonensis]